jgi:hypothetical protein
MGETSRISAMKLFKLAMLTSFISVGMFSASNVIGFALTTLIIITLLALSYSIRYWREGIGVELAYWGLVYAAFGLVLLGIATLQSHAGCMFLIGDCYQPRLPSWLSNFKILYGLKLLAVNSIVVTVIILNVIRLLKPVPVVTEIKS